MKNSDQKTDATIAAEVLISRVTDPSNMILIGIPPKDMVEDVAQALRENGMDPDAVFARACEVTQEWQYDHTATLLRNRFKQRFVSERTVPLKHRIDMGENNRLYMFTASPGAEKYKVKDSR